MRHAQFWTLYTFGLPDYVAMMGTTLVFFQHIMQLEFCPLYIAVIYFTS